MGYSDFKNSVKQRLAPFGAPTLMNPSSYISGQQPREALAPKSPLLLHMGQILGTGGSQVIQDMAATYWFSALQPVTPIAPPDYRPRQRAFVPGENIIWTPGEDKGGIDFEMLRSLADSLDILRVVIETRKDQLANLGWEIRVKGEYGESFKDKKQRNLEDPNVGKLNEFFNCPDGFHSWEQWLRMWIEDVLVLDGGALYLERDEKGRIASIVPLDGATIARMITDQGITPSPPDVAYQQIVYGAPACNLTTDDLIYLMRNERTHRRYGYSAVEQILVTIGIALRRQEFQLQYYTSGNIPEALCFLPPGLPIEKVAQIQGWFDTILAGDLAKRRRLTFLPGYGQGESAHSNVLFPKEPLLKDDMDEWLARIVCFAFSITPQNLVKQMNRASSEMAAEVAKEEGLAPMMQFIAAVMNRILQKMGMGDGYEFAWRERRTVDIVKQAQADNLLLGKVYTINETREVRGEDPREEPEANMLGTFTPNGFIPLGVIANQKPDTPAGDKSPSGGKQTQGKPSTPGTKPKPRPASESSNAKLYLASAPDPMLKVVRFEKTPPELLADYGDISGLEQFFAYCPDTKTAFVKGPINVVEAVSNLRIKYPSLFESAAND